MSECWCFAIVLYCVMIEICFSSLSHPLLLQSNNSKPTLKPLSISTTDSYYTLCNNITSCNECMNAKDLYNIQCSWIEYSKNKNYSWQCIERNLCFNEDIECCNSMKCCNCLSQSNCKQCGSQGLNVSCLWDHTNTKCFPPNHTCSGKLSFFFGF